PRAALGRNPRARPGDRPAAAARAEDREGVREPRAERTGAVSVAATGDGAAAARACAQPHRSRQAGGAGWRGGGTRSGEEAATRTVAGADGRQSTKPSGLTLIRGAVVDAGQWPRGQPSPGGPCRVK